MKIKNIILIIILIALALSTGLFQHSAPKLKHGSHGLWYCPMHPQYTSDRPGHCPICGMDLVKQEDAPREKKSGVEGYTTILVTTQKQQLIGVRTAVVTKKGEAIIVPRNAVMDTGIRKIVFVQKDGETFEPREIQTSRETDDGFKVKSGLRTGERIVISGNFLLDSESRVQAGLEGDSHE